MSITVWIHRPQGLRFFRKLRRELPESWSELRPGDRRKCLRAMLRADDVGQNQMLNRVLHLPFFVRAELNGENRQALLRLLDWAKLAPNCQDYPLQNFRHRRQTYLLPKPKGSDLVCIEYPLAEEFFNAYIAGGEPRHLVALAAVLCSPPDIEGQRSHIRSRADVERRAEKFKNLPPEVLTATTLWFAGFKKYFIDTYGGYLFDLPDDDDENDIEEDDTQRDGSDAPADAAPKSPDFGWWGVFQSVAESGTFGTLREVQQTNLHEVCIYLVRKSVEAEEMKRQASRRPSTTASDEF